MMQLKLTLSCPQFLADQVVEALLDSEWAVDGFATVAAGGHGANFATASLLERVRGRIQTTQIQLILPAAHVAPLLEALRGQFQGAQIRYWTEPVQDSGDFT